MVLPDSSYWTTKISYDVVTSLLHNEAICAVLMSLYTIAAKYNGPLEAAHAHNDDDRYNTIW